MLLNVLCMFYPFLHSLSIKVLKLKRNIQVRGFRGLRKLTGAGGSFKISSALPLPSCHLPACPPATLPRALPLAFPSYLPAFLLWGVRLAPSLAAKQAGDAGVHGVQTPFSQPGCVGHLLSSHEVVLGHRAAPCPWSHCLAGPDGSQRGASWLSLERAAGRRRSPRGEA